MYEQENFTNESNNGFYQTAQSAPSAPVIEPAKPKKTKKKGKTGGFFKKVLCCICCGLLFGLCAGVGLYTVAECTGFLDEWRKEEVFLDKQSNQYQGTVSEQEDAYVKAESASSVVRADEGQQVIYVSSDVSDVVREVMPSMVSIGCNYVEKYSYFGQVIEREGVSSGSGIIVGENEQELLIATNYHVVADAEKLTVNFINGKEVEAVVKGTDSDMDLAVIAVSLIALDEDTLNTIHIAKLGDSDALALGEPVIAIGNALGYGQSVTGGWVSALNREVELEDGSTGTFIQTDAAINPGNSGGALLNIEGEVIGINSNKIGGTAIEGIGYAIPISAAQPILEELMTKETRTKVEDGNSGYLGIIPQSVTAAVAQVYGMPEGVFVSSMEQDTPAARGGMLRGDIIVKLDGNRLSTAEELRELLEYYKAGETVEIIVKRNVDGEYTDVTLQVTLGSRPRNEE